MLERQVLKYLYANYPLAIFMTLLLNGMLMSVVGNDVNMQTLLLWYLTLVVLQLFRFGDYLYFRLTHQGEIYSIFAMFRNFRLGVLASAITVGSLPLLIFSSVNLTELVFIAFVFAGITAGATSNLGVDRSSLLLYMFPVLLPLAFCFFRLEGSMATIMGFMIPLYMAYLIINGNRFLSRLTENVLLREEALKREKAILLQQKVAELIVKIQSAYMDERINSQFFQRVAQEIVKISGSNYGFICRIRQKSDMLMDSVVIANVGYLSLKALHGESLQIDELNHRPLSLEAYFSQVVLSRRVMEVDHIEFRQGQPPHTTLGNFHGFPLLNEDRVIGVVGLVYAYDAMPAEMPDLLKPVLHTLERLLAGRWPDRRGQERSARNDGESSDMRHHPL